MPPITKNCTSLLSISLDGSRIDYAPGDVLVGQVIRRQPMVSAEAVITLALLGQAITRLEFQLENQKVRHSRFQLIDDHQSRQHIHDGPIHIPQGGKQPLVIPFSIQVPTYVSDRLAGSGMTSYLPLHPSCVAQQRLPSTIVASSRHGRIEAFIEYFLEAKILIKGKEINSATLPITIHSKFDGSSITDYHVRSSQQLCVITSKRLLPGAQDSRPSMKEKMKAIFATEPDPVPRFGFRLEVGVSSLMQLEEPGPIPLTLRAVPDWRFTSDSIRGTLPKVELRNMNMALGSKTLAQADSASGPIELDSEGRVDIPIERVFSACLLQGKQVFIPCTDDLPLLDVGGVVNLNVGYDGFAGIWKKLPGPPCKIRSTTVTYNFQITHVLYWEAILDVVGEECKVKGEQVVEILPSVKAPPSYTEPPRLTDLPSTESWIQPPAEGDAPPSFTQVQEEDMVMREGKGNSEQKLTGHSEAG